jgi:hypothetical protein
MPEPALHTDSLHCAGCGYNLFGIESDRCPECGLAIDRSVQGESRIPWVHRQRIGRIRALWRTVVLFTIHPRIIAQEVNRPVGYADAIKFRRVCLVLATSALLPLIAVVVAILDIPMHWWERVALGLICGFSAWVYLLSITGFPSLFFHPKTLPLLRQNRAVALSFYSAGALAWMFVPVLILGISLLIINGPNRWFYEGETLLVVGVGFFGLLFAAHFGSSVLLLKHATHCSATRRCMMDICLVMSWFVLLWIVMIGIPAIAIYLAVIVQSLI